MPRPIAIDLFAGAGGFSLGVEQAGFDVKAAIEYDPIHCAVHEYNFPETTTICRSVIDLTGLEIRAASALQETEIDLVVGGPPCQGVSLMGHRALEDPRNSLMLHFVRLVLELNPRYFIMENVKGLTVGLHKQILSEVMSLFDRNGYTVEQQYKVLNAANYGVPQDRQRVFILGCRRDLELPHYPMPTTDVVLRSERAWSSMFGLPEGPSVLDAIGDLPNADLYPELLIRDHVQACFGEPSRYAAVLRGCADGADFGHPREIFPDALTSSMRTVHTQESADRFAATLPGHIEPVSRFLKLHPDGVCNTLRAGTGSDRGAYTSPRPIHPLYPRCITVREAARLHSYPDWFRFHITKWHGFRQVGNSVPPFLGRSVAAEVIRVLGYAPNRPSTILANGSVGLLAPTMTAAALYYDVHKHVTGRRTRDRAENALSTTFDDIKSYSTLELELREGRRRIPTMVSME